MYCIGTLTKTRWNHSSSDFSDLSEFTCHSVLFEIIHGIKSANSMLLTFACYYFGDFFFFFFLFPWNNSAFLLSQEDSERARYSHRSSRHSYLVCVQTIFPFLLCPLKTVLFGVCVNFTREQMMLCLLSINSFRGQYFKLCNVKLHLAFHFHQFQQGSLHICMHLNPCI